MKDTLLLSHAIFTGDEFSGPGLEDNIQKAIDDVLPKFLDSGIDVKVIVTYSDSDAWPKEIGRKMMPKLDGYCIDIKLHGGNDFHHSSWPRDLFMQKDNLIYSPKEKTRIVVNMIDKLEPKRFILKSSKLGTGGMTVSDSGYYVSSHKLKNSAEKQDLKNTRRF